MALAPAAAGVLFAHVASAETEPETQREEFFNGFETEQIKTSGATIKTVYGGNRNGSPVLLLHGIPETHVLWRKVAPALAQDFFVVMTDLRGYGDSSKPPGGGDHFAYSKRAMAQDQVEVMKQLGFEKFALVGHDRGGRAAHRLALDHSLALTKLVILDIVPTRRFGNRIRSMPSARIIARRPRLTSRTIRRTSTKRFSVRCSCCGRKRGRSIACTTFCRLGGIAPSRLRAR